ncbi:OXA1L mitochondrial inner membrane protein [Calliopsis andreniformis]|uniref:OXA1L mitochondrial inner membrane protein n=1 Tax=Calliopsis andreniformis TaxID=337506 RepID=UPI003FCE8589
MLSRLSTNAGRKLLLSTNTKSQRIAKCNFNQLACNVVNVSLRNNHVFNVHKHSKVLGILCVRYQSTIDTPTTQSILNISTDPSAQQIPKTVQNINDTVIPQSEDIIKSIADDTGAKETFISEIPDIPSPPVQDTIIDTVVKLHPNGEPTLESLGLGGYSPIGLAQSSLEFIHIYCDVPWWAAITIGTLIVRTLMFPLVVISQKSSTHMANHMPGMQRLQLKMTEARQCGNQYEAAMYANDIAKYMRERKLNPLKSFVVILAQLPIFLSFFWGLKRMADVPVEGLRTGGLWWFTDLTVCDPYYILPVMTSVVLYGIFQFSAASSAGIGNPIMAKYLFRAIPIIAFPFLINFPAAILCYWFSTNCISIIQIGLLKTPKVRKYFNIPERIIRKEQSVLKQPKNFMEGLKESWTNVKISKKVQDQFYADSVQFTKAGKGPLKKTFKYDPTKTPSAATVLTKKR